MTTLQEMHERTVSSYEFDRMLRSIRPLCDYLNVNFFYYLRILTQGDKANYIFLGTHLKWQEYSYNDPTSLSSWPVLRHPDKLSSKIDLIKHNADHRLSHLLEVAWNKFGINFSLGIQRKIDRGIESYGFGLSSQHCKAEEQLLNELPLLKNFISFFHTENKGLLNLASENQVEISSLLGPTFYDMQTLSTPSIISPNKKTLLKQLGLESIFLLSIREMDILKFIAYGLPASYIAMKLHLSYRTVENHVASIKSKLDCHSKVELIKKAQDIISVIYPFETLLGSEDLL